MSSGKSDLTEYQGDNAIRRLLKGICILSFALTAVITARLFVTREGKIARGGQPFKYPLSALVQLAALYERQVYFRTWLDQIIGPGIENPEEKINLVFRHVSELDDVPESIRKKGNVEQHEYYTLIKQYGTISEKVRTFCLLVTVAGYQAIPFRSDADGKVIVRIPATDTWLKYDLKNRKSNIEVEGVKLSEEVKNRIRAIDSWVKKVVQRQYTRGDRNIPLYRVSFEAEKPFFGATCILAITNDKMDPEPCT